MFNAMLTHGSNPEDLLLSTIISIPKDKRGSMNSVVLTSEWSGRVSVTGALSLHLWCIDFIDYDQFCYITLHCDYVSEYGFITNMVDSSWKILFCCVSDLCRRCQTTYMAELLKTFGNIPSA